MMPESVGPTGEGTDYPMFDRELSWLAFNERVLQEAADERVPLLERLRFLAIFSSNLDEFFRVRVASLRSLLRLKKKARRGLAFHPRRLLQEIHAVVHSHQERFGQILREQILPDLGRRGIVLLGDRQLRPDQVTVLAQVFEETVQPHLTATTLGAEAQPGLFLRNGAIYLVVELWPRPDKGFSAPSADYGLVEIPSPPLGRFVSLPAEKGRRLVIFLDDVVRLFLNRVFPDRDVGAAYSVKLTRDANLPIEDEFAGDLVDMIRKALAKRDLGVPSRFLYDGRAPYALISRIKTLCGLEDDDMVLGGRYHNLSDFFAFPDPGWSELVYAPWPRQPFPPLERADDLFAAIRRQDHLLHLPYHGYESVVQFLDASAADAQVKKIWITLYRVAPDSAVTRALIRAAESGKRVSAFVEVKARFDEAPNLAWAEKLEAAGVHVRYSMPGIKVHAKLVLVERRDDDASRGYAYLSTGNLNEKTAALYADFGLFTADERLTRDVRRVFSVLFGNPTSVRGEHCLVAPWQLRDAFERLIEFEIAEARRGRPAFIVAKMNSLEDERIIGRLREAAEAGVRISLVVRGICRFVPPAEGDLVRVVSIIDRYLEHSRVYWFHHAGEDLIYLASADWMTRNLSRRIEIAFPLYARHVRAQIKEVIGFQLADNVKARRIDAAQQNERVDAAGRQVRAQEASFEFVKAGCRIEE